jgi:hypothetical protein
LMLLSKIFQKLCMFLLFLCPGTILAPSCRASCQASSSPPPSSGSVGAASSHPFSHSTTAPTSSCAADPLLHHPSRVPGRGHRCQPPQGLHGRRRHAWQPTSLRQTAGFAPRRSCRSQVGLIFRSAGFFTFPPALPPDGPGTVFLPIKEVFARPGLAAPSQVPQTWYPSCQRASPQRLDL